MNTYKQKKSIHTNTNEYKENTPVFKENTNAGKSNTHRFTTKQFDINGELPCPICGEWKNSSNFSRHAKGHGSTTEEIFTSEKYKEMVKAMIEEKGK